MVKTRSAGECHFLKNKASSTTKTSIEQNLFIYAISRVDCENLEFDTELNGRSIKATIDTGSKEIYICDALIDESLVKFAPEFYVKVANS